MKWWRLIGVECMLALCCQFAWAAPPEGAATPRFEKLHLTRQYWSEGASLGDLNRDGQLDLVCGAHYYLGPGFAKRCEYTLPVPGNKRHPYDKDVYTIEHFFSWVADFNSDGWPDILVVPLPGRAVHWFENPGRFPERPEVVHWAKHLVLPKIHVETSLFEDITGDGRPELICGLVDRLGYAHPAADPNAPWEFVAVTPKVEIQNWMANAHGLGVGDVDGDGRQDLLRPDGWWQQPRDTSEKVARDKPWRFHPFKFTPRIGGAEMYAYDVNGDGLNDIVTSLNAHGWGLSWFEQVRSADGAIGFREHEILGKTEGDPANAYGVQFSQLHAVALVDIDGDGLKDILTGKTYLAHEYGDPGVEQPPVVYWFRLTRHEGKAEFVPELIDAEVGIGRRIDVGDINRDGLADFVVGNKKGAAVFLQKGGK